MKKYLYLLTITASIFACTMTEVRHSAYNVGHPHWDNPPMLTPELMREIVGDVQ